MSKQDSFALLGEDVEPSAPPCYAETVTQQSFAGVQQVYPSIQPSYPVPAAQPPYPGPYAQPSQVVNVQRVIPLPVGPKAMTRFCPQCNKDVVTRTSTIRSCWAHVCCLFLCCVVCCIPCSSLPYCIDTFKSVKHNCPNCGAYFGSYRP